MSNHGKIYPGMQGVYTAPMSQTPTPPSTTRTANVFASWPQLKNFSISGPLLIVGASALWALDGITRRSLFVLPPVTIVFLEHFICSLLLIPAAIPLLRRAKISARAWQLTAFIALFSGLFGTLWITTALSRVHFIPFSVVYLLLKLQPLFTIAAAYILLKEKITKEYAIWALVALTAAYFVTFPSGLANFATCSVTIIAALYAVGAAFVWGTGTVFSKMLLKETGDSTLSTVLRFWLASAFGLIAVFVMGAQSSFAVITLSQIARLIFIGFSTGMVAMLIYYRGLMSTPAKISALLELTLPLLAVLIDVVLYKTYLASSQYLAAAVLLFAMYRVGKLK